jgi:hypothetical protein
MSFRENGVERESQQDMYKGAPGIMEPSVLGRPPEGMVGPVHGNVQNVHQLDHDPADVFLSPHSDYPLHLQIFILMDQKSIDTKL